MVLGEPAPVAAGWPGLAGQASRCPPSGGIPGFSEQGRAWVVSAYAIPFGGLLLLAGDLPGRRRMFGSGIAVFTAASLACGLSGTAPMLVAARFAQGIGGAMTAAVVLGIIVPLSPARDERARALGVAGLVLAAGGPAGSLLGGLVTQALSWHWIFFIDIPIGLATVLLAARLVAADQGADQDAGLGAGRGAAEQHEPAARSGYPC